MIIYLRQLFDVIGDHKRIDYKLDLSEYTLDQNKPFPHPVHVVGEITNQVGIVTLQMTVSTLANFVCDRCLDEFQVDYEEEFEHIIVRKLTGQNDDYIVAENARLDLDELVLNDVALSLPTKILCKEDCKGLCCNCGANLNITECKCGEFQ